MSQSDATTKNNQNDQAPWYSAGLRFECTQCGECCSGEPGYVWIDDQEIRAMARHLDLSVEAFEKRFIRRINRAKSLTERDNGDCILLDPVTRRCTVYQSRPIQCRTWPFWDSNLKKKKDWKETCQVCPGAGKGKLYSLAHIEESRKQKHV